MKAYVEIPLFDIDIREAMERFKPVTELGFDVMIDVDERVIIISWKYYEKARKGTIRYIKSNRYREEEERW